MKKLAAAVLAMCAAALGHETLTTTVLFDREIRRILDSHCVMCHAEKGPSFPLETYEQTWLRKRPIRAEVISRHMPPWPAVPGYGQFANDNGLTLRETQFVVSWVEGLGPRNSGTVFTNTAVPGAPRPAVVSAHPDFGHWHLGQPQLTRQLSANAIEPQSGNQMKRVVVDLGLTQGRRLQSLEYMPGDRRVVRAAFFTIQETGQWIGSWTPWYGFYSLPKGAAIPLAAGSHVVAELYYRGVKERVTDQGTLGLTFASEPSSNPVSDIVLNAKGEGQKLQAATRLTAETHVVALRTQTMEAVKSIEVSARKPDGGTAVLLFAKDFQQDWPTPYIFKEPMVLPSGSELRVVAYTASAATIAHPAELRLTASMYRKPAAPRALPHR
ncbi:MAG TPA: hypothetical protein VIY49_15105 [Bryobacteraceae bacterium]